ncbi:hypothetical protein [Limosilactobacillus antri]|uniref:hypothetical protein n=1 Tax=Limosilactobacillus antri TaxID=227943 RepID=UPI001F562AFE|nr:hypothetical protein [Limosilactobacillus antri]
MMKIREAHYCRAIIICHGKSELLLFSRLKSILRLPIEVVGSDNGKSSVKIQGLESFLRRDEYRTKKAFCRNFFRESYRAKTFPHLITQVKVFAVMDIDDATTDQVKRYKNCEYFKTKWLKPCCVPIYNDPNLEKTVLKIGMDVPTTNNEKAIFYQKLWAKSLQSEADVKKIYIKLKECRYTNMEKVIKYLLSI